MAASYPGAVKNFSTVVNGITKLVAALFNSPYDEITALQTELGTDVAGSVADLKTRLAVAINNDGTLKVVAVACGGTGVALTQRGRTTALNNGQTHSYGTTFGDTNYTLIATPEATGGVASFVTAKSATGFTVYVASGSIVFNYLAIDDV